jgi:hypothetical protein
MTDFLISMIKYIFYNLDGIVVLNDGVATALEIDKA